MSFCTQCGSRLGAQASFCSSCGQQQTTTAALAEATPWAPPSFHSPATGGLFPAIPRAATRDRMALFAHTMSLVAIALGFAAVGMYLGRHLDPSRALYYWLGGLVFAFGLNAATRRSQQLGMFVLFAMATALGLAVSPTVARYAHYDPAAVWKAGVTTALAVAALGTYGYAMRRDLAFLGRAVFFTLLGLIAVGLFVLLTGMSHGMVIYCVLGLVVFSGVTVYDFNRLSHRGSYQNAALIAANIFLDILNIFLFLLRLFGGGRR
jgi:FtsH-binding integral membrane protein